MAAAILRNLAPGSIRRIMVRMPNWIGDAVMATPALMAIRRSYPQAQVTVVANSLVTQLFTVHPGCDQVFGYDKKLVHRGPTGFLRFCAELRRARFDLAILLQNAFEAAGMALLAGIPRRAGYRTECRGPLLNAGVVTIDKKHGLHHVDYYLHMLRQLGFTAESPMPCLALTTAEKQQAAAILGAGKWLAICPGASYGTAKRWIPQRFAAAAEALCTEYGMNAVLVGGPEEREIGSVVEHGMRNPPLNLVGRTSLRELMAVLAHCRLVLANDSGPMHIASAFSVPVVAIFGSTDHAATAPVSDKFRIVRKAVECSPCMLRECPIDHRCMELVTADDVVAAARDLLGSPR